MIKENRLTMQYNYESDVILVRDLDDTFRILFNKEQSLQFLRALESAPWDKNYKGITFLDEPKDYPGSPTIAVEYYKGPEPNGVGKVLIKSVYGDDIYAVNSLTRLTILQLSDILHRYLWKWITGHEVAKPNVEIVKYE